MKLTTAIVSSAAALSLAGGTGVYMMRGEGNAPNHMATVAAVKAAHPEINTCDEDSLDKGRAAIVDWTAQRLNKDEGRVVWGRKSRGKVVNGVADRPNTDGLTYLRSDGTFEIIDAFNGGDCSPAWESAGYFEQGSNGYWAPPQLGPEPSGGGPTTPPADCSAVATSLLACQSALESCQADNGVELCQNKLIAVQAELDALKAKPPAKCHLDGGPAWVRQAFGIRCIVEGR